MLFRIPLTDPPVRINPSPDLTACIKLLSYNSGSHFSDYLKALTTPANCSICQIWLLVTLGRHNCRLITIRPHSEIRGIVLTGLLSMFCLLLRPFLMWLFKALESRGLSSSKLHNSSSETAITAPQLSNSPQYYTLISETPNTK